MPLSSPSERTEIHHRSLHFRGYRRVDGLFDIECTLVDIKGMDIPLLGTQRIVPAGEPVHAMRSFRASHPAAKIFIGWIGGGRDHAGVASHRGYRRPP